MQAPSLPPTYAATLRILRLVDLLACKSLTRDEIAAELEVSYKSAERYIKALDLHFGEHLIVGSRMVGDEHKERNTKPVKTYTLNPKHKEEHFAWAVYRHTMPRAKRIFNPW